MNDKEEIRTALESARTVAIVGCSPDPERPSNVIARYLMEQGYQVVPVNPGHRRILGETCYRSLSEIPGEVRLDIVDVFRRSGEVAPVAQEAIVRGVGFFFNAYWWSTRAEAFPGGISKPVENVERLPEFPVPGSWTSRHRN